MNGVRSSERRRPLDAFPTAVNGYPGMTFRDYFAAHAPVCPGWFYADIVVCSAQNEIFMARLGQWPWVYADAMLKARETPPDDRQ